MQLSDFLFSHPLVTSCLLIIVGIIMGFLITLIFYEMVTPAVPYTDMDEIPEMDLKKDLYVCVTNNE